MECIILCVEHLEHSTLVIIATKTARGQWNGTMPSSILEWSESKYSNPISRSNFGLHERGQSYTLSKFNLRPKR